jgi:ABC-type polysaccharide/polyol phosphate export permease
LISRDCASWEVTSHRRTGSDVAFAVHIARLSARDYRAQCRPGVLVWSVSTRAVLQTLFLTLLGRYGGQARGMDFAFVGAIAIVPTAAVLVKATDVITAESAFGTLYRLRLGGTPVLWILLLRSWVYVVEGLAAAMVAIAIVGLPLVGVERALRLAAAMPIVALTTVSCLMVGLCVGVLSLGRRSETVLANTASYLVLLTSGAVFPIDRVPVLAKLGALLPVRHGIVALRLWMDHSPSWSPLADEATVAAGWLVVTWVALRAQHRRARRKGPDQLT